MLKSFSNKAISTKARAMYGQRMTAADYEELMKKRTVGDAAAYLRDSTHYREVLTQVEPSAVHRGQLENFLRSLRYLQYQRLTAYDFGEQEFYRFLYMRDEIQQLMALLRYLSGRGQGQASGQYDFHFDRRLADHTSYDLLKLVTIRSYPELIEFLGDSPYGRLLKQYPPDPSGQIDLLECERSLYIHYYKKLLGIIEKEFGGEAGKALRTVVYERIDTENITQAYRLKRFFHSDPDFIRRSLLPFPTSSRRLIDQMIDAGSIAELHSILAGTKLVREAPDTESDFIENMVLRIRGRQSKRNLRYSVHPPVVLEAYMTQMEIELENIINIIESVRYELPIDEMRNMLIL